jgi:8-oxo-dGTP pyrophosphatase MutT (NUDIX family)
VVLHPSELRPDADLGRAREILLAYAAQDVEQNGVRHEILEFIEAHPENAHERSCLSGHLTGSVFLLDHSRERVLLTLHRKLGKWLQLGGHCDGDANLVNVALREAQEESGIDDITIEPAPIDLDVHTIPERKGTPEHLHLDVRFVAYAPEGAREIISEESIDLSWIPLNEVQELTDEVSVLRPIRRILELAGR